MTGSDVFLFQLDRRLGHLSPPDCSGFEMKDKVGGRLRRLRCVRVPPPKPMANKQREKAGVLRRIDRREAGVAMVVLEACNHDPPELVHAAEFSGNPEMG